jgi:ABC-type phosphate transport system substrate-binding protein
MRSIRSRVARPKARAAPALAVFAVVAALLAAMVVTPSIGAAATRRLTVTPASALTDQVVTVSWSGFTPTTPEGLNQVVIQQCKGNPKSLADCFTAAPFPNSANGNEIVNGTTLANGTGTAELEIRPAAQLPELGCNEANPCVVLAYENQVVPAGKLPTLSAMAPIEFARSTADCPAVTNFDVRVEGEASGAPVLYDWAARRCTGANHLVIDYTQTSSDSGRSDYLKKLVDVGLTSLPATPAELKASPGYPAFAYAPIDMTGLAVAFNIHDVETNQPITDMTLSPRLLARLISDTDMGTFFQDPEFKRLNPKHSWPVNGASTPLIRAEANADTWITTNWIASSKNAEAFLQGKDPDHVAVNAAFENVKYPTSIFENRALDDAYLPREGQYAVVTHIFYAARPADTSPLDPASYGFMGVVDLPTAESFNLPTAKLVNASGQAVAPTMASLVAGFNAMVPGAGGTLVANPASTDPAAYPLVKVDYLMVPKQTDAKHKAHIQDLLTWGATEGQKSLPAGYFPLTSNLVSQTEKVAAAISVPVPVVIRATTTTTVKPGSTTVPTTAFQPSSDSCCASTGDPSVGGVTPVTAAGATGTTSPSTTKKRGAAGPVTTSTATPTATSAAAAPAATIASAGATLALPALFGTALLAAAIAATRRLWPRLLKSRRLAKILPSKLRGASSATA